MYAVTIGLASPPAAPGGASASATGGPEPATMGRASTVSAADGGSQAAMARSQDIGNAYIAL